MEQALSTCLPQKQTKTQFRASAVIIQMQTAQGGCKVKGNKVWVFAMDHLSTPIPTIQINYMAKIECRPHHNRAAKFRWSYFSLVNQQHSFLDVIDFSRTVLTGGKVYCWMCCLCIGVYVFLLHSSLGLHHPPAHTYPEQWKEECAPGPERLHWLGHLGPWVCHRSHRRPAEVELQTRPW